jgi:hypothetical protein
MPRILTVTANTKLRPADYEALRQKAASYGLSVGAFLRFLVVEALGSKDSDLLQAVDSEHTRLVILVAQQGQKLTPELLKSLREQAIVRAPALVANTLRLLKQNALLHAE